MNTEKVIEKLKSDDVIPDVIPNCNGIECSVEFPSGKCAEFGNVILKTDASEEPKLIWNAEDKKMYTIIMTDPDAISRENPIYRECIHWLVTNVKGSKINTGEVITPYAGPGPHENTGEHRYCVLIYKQTSQINGVKHMIQREERRNFNATKFANEHNLNDPIAVNYFISMY